ncbi:MAG: Ribosomal large subunit pseudouridine synthase D [Chlamydiae bacterium]|nr:Ribosomal large subunit pseudouridine synthase D [Chlamydiota bacterium]
MKKITVNENGRLLTFLKTHFSPKFSTRDLHFSLDHNRCRVNGKIERFASSSLKKGEVVSFFPVKPPQFSLDPPRVLFEDSHLLLYNKPPGISSPDLAKKLGFLLVHRLDRDTTGLFLLAKTPQAQERLQDLFRQRRCVKEYVAFVEGTPTSTGLFKGKMEIASRREGAVKWKVTSSPKGLFSQTSWESLESKKNTSLLLCRPLTGRTHQIRVHLSHIGHPILGDVDYGKKDPPPRFFRPHLHAYSLLFPHPFTQENLSIQTPPPEDFLENITSLGYRYSFT